MGRAPCCEKMGLKKGPWTPEEDETLISYIRQHGHSNWRALPKQAGLSRCGKSCRLRWFNYLRPDIKRGNFSKEEEETILELHKLLGNRSLGSVTDTQAMKWTSYIWSAIASRLPGRTDNEIKNFWHSHLKKRVEQESQVPAAAPLTRSINNIIPLKNGDRRIQCPIQYAPTTFFRLDDDLHNKLLSKRTCSSPNIINADPGLQPPFSSSSNSTAGQIMKREGSKTHEDIDFWYSLFMKAGEPSTVALPVCHCMMEFSAI
ncbi:unnamed protein product [Prunus armeniaca]|uniref:Uncharacterized protein n=1 Tax=Prunus armeniaca TaxID=36596 RepID=A0A6J5XQA4_PRUAR|nr:unnamed protein product [Prunus armeniaca]